MVEATKRLNEKIEELVNLCVTDTSMDSIMSITDNDFHMMKVACGLVKELENLLMKQAIIIDGQNKKIDELLVIVKRTSTEK